MSETGVKQWEHSVAPGQWVIAEPQEDGTTLYTCFEGASPLEPVSLWVDVPMTMGDEQQTWRIRARYTPGADQMELLDVEELP